MNSPVSQARYVFLRGDLHILAPLAPTPNLTLRLFKLWITLIAGLATRHADKFFRILVAKTTDGDWFDWYLKWWRVVGKPSCWSTAEVICSCFQERRTSSELCSPSSREPWTSPTPSLRKPASSSSPSWWSCGVRREVFITYYIVFPSAFLSL